MPDEPSGNRKDRPRRAPGGAHAEGPGRQPSVAIDARMVNASGIGTYLRGLLAFLPEVAGPDRFALIGRPEELAFSSLPVTPLSRNIYSIREQVEVPRAFGRTRASLLHVPHYNVPALTVARSLVTVHDLIHLRFPQFLRSRAALAYARFLLGEIVPRARAILTVSEHSKRDLCELLKIPPGRITVTPLGVTPEHHPRGPEEIAPVLARHGLEPGYLLYLGNIKEFKNVPLLLDTYLRLRSSLGLPPLVLVGRNSIPGFEERIREAPGVRWIPGAERAELPFFYCGARLFLFPSLYEGFGLPPLEAMACGTPVVCSGRASLPEVVGDAAVLVDPESALELGSAITRVLSDEAMQERMRRAGIERARGFTWRRTAEMTWGVMEGLL